MPKISEDDIVQIEVRIDEDKCVGCGTCVEVCPVQVLEMKTVGKKKKTSAPDTSFCVKCHMCEFHCGYEAIKVFPPFEGQQPTDQAKVPMRHRHDH
jgi:formate hydrogenlyase subunit 6/NADH:ubiquinone oxidoreductase subunit I